MKIRRKKHEVKVVTDIGLFNMQKERHNIRMLRIKYENTDFSTPDGDEEFQRFSDDYISANQRYWEASQNTRVVTIYARSETSNEPTTNTE